MNCRPVQRAPALSQNASPGENSPRQRQISRPPAALGLCLAVCLALSGCSTYADRLRDVRAGYFNGDLTFARQTIEENLKKRPKEQDVLRLERAMLELAEGRPQDAERTLREVRDRFDELEQKSLAEGALAMLSDDNANSYAGEDYEKVLMRSMLCISNLLGNGEDAEAYALQTIDKQQQIIDTGTDANGENPKLAYQRVALGAYVHGLLREQTHNAYDDVERANILVCNWQPDFPFGPVDLQRAQAGRHSSPGNGVLYVFTLVGAGPFKVETVEIPSQVAMLIADRILSNNLNQTLPPTIAPIKVPKVVTVANSVSHVAVAVDGRPAGSTATITDIGKLAVQQYDAIYPQVLARAIVRRVVKKGAIYAAKEVTGQEKGTLGGVAFDVAGVVWEATESADTRCWGTLPDKIQVLRIELPAGQRQITLRPQGLGLPGSPASQTVEIADGRNTYLLANFPGTKLVGKVLTSQP